MNDYEKIERAAELTFEVYEKQSPTTNVAMWLDAAHRHLCDSLGVLTKPEPESVETPASDDGALYGLVSFTYTNWKGVVATRKAYILSVFWGHNEWHTTPQWLVKGVDMDKQAVRSYALKDITDVKKFSQGGTE